MARPVRIVDAGYDTEDFQYRTPIKFGGVSVDRATILRAWMRIESPDGKIALGRGAMPLGNVWAFPSTRLSYNQTLSAMRSLADSIGGSYYDCPLQAHPIEFTVALEPSWTQLARQVEGLLNLGESIPKLAILVAGSAFDAALHDAYGKLFGLSSYATLGRDFLARDLSSFLGQGFEGIFLNQAVRPMPVPLLPVYHLVGALDPLTQRDVKQPVGDGWPETLGQWIERDGLTHFKIKLAGDNLGWDVQRVLAVDEVVAETQTRLGVRGWVMSLDFNEKCPNIEYVVEFFRKLHNWGPEAMSRIHYVEQPLARQLNVKGQSVQAVSQIRPLAIDESAVDYQSILLARQLGYTAIAVKACKGQTQSLLMAAAALKQQMFVFVQDLTCPGAAFVHSAGLAAHIPSVGAVEANARQYMPQANAKWLEDMPWLFQVKRGRVRTAELTGPGLSAYPIEN